MRNTLATGPGCLGSSCSRTPCLRSHRIPHQRRKQDRGTKAKKGLPRGDGVPALLWGWLACTFSWLLVATVNYVHPTKKVEAKTTEALQLTSYVFDPSDLLSPAEQARVTQLLSEFEKESSNQIALAVYPQAPSDEEIDDFTIRMAEGSGLGEKGRDNGAILFLFLKEHVARMEVGYGLEGVLPDATVHCILEQQLASRFARGELGDGVEHTLSAIIERTRSEYRAGRAPGILRLTWARLRSVVTTYGPTVWPFLQAIESSLTLSKTGEITRAILDTSGPK
jgi:uncharacterized membrane protein YgcG